MAETEKSQLERFKEVAKDVEADTSDDAIDKIMGKLDLTKNGSGRKERQLSKRAEAALLLSFALGYVMYDTATQGHRK